MSDENEKEEVVPDFEEPRAPGVVSGTGQHQPVRQDESGSNQPDHQDESVSNRTVPGDDVPEAPDDFGHGPSGQETSDDVDERLANDDDDDDDDDDDNGDNETA